VPGKAHSHAMLQTSAQKRNLNPSQLAMQVLPADQTSRFWGYSEVYCVAVWWPTLGNSATQDRSYLRTLFAYDCDCASSQQSINKQSALSMVDMGISQQQHLSILEHQPAKARQHKHKPASSCLAAATHPHHHSAGTPPPTGRQHQAQHTRGRRPGRAPASASNELHMTDVNNVQMYAAGGGTLATALSCVMRVYRHYQDAREKLSEKEIGLLSKVQQVHAACGCSNPAEPPKEFLVDPDTDKPFVVDPGQIALCFQPVTVQQSMRIEIVELVELLSVLEDVDEEHEKHKSRPCAFWQLVLELNRWMATELPGLLDEVRGPRDWEARLRCRVDYLKGLVALCERHELDPEKNHASWMGKRWCDKETKERRDRRFARVMHALQDHLLQISCDHAKVMSERVTADLLQQLEHSVKGVVRPTLHAALIVLSNVKTTDGMVFSELAAATDHVWSWMAELKNSRLCQVLTAAIRTDTQLQQGLHIVNVEARRTSHVAQFTMESVTHDARELIGLLTGLGKKDNSGMPRGKSARAQELLAPEVFRPALEKLGEVTNVLAQKIGKGLTLLRETQTLAKQVGELMFVKTCEQDVNIFLTEMFAVIKQMVHLVGNQETGVLAEMERLRRKMRDDTAVEVKADLAGTQEWSNNMDKASKLVRLAQKNLGTVTATVNEIRDLTNAANAKDASTIIKQWKHNLRQFTDTFAGAEPEPEVAEPEPELETIDGDHQAREGIPPIRRPVCRDVLERAKSFAAPLLTFCQVDYRRQETASDTSRYSVYPIVCTDKTGHSWECVKRHEQLVQLHKSVHSAFAGSDPLDTLCCNVPPPQADGKELPEIEHWLRQVVYMFWEQSADVQEFFFPPQEAVWEVQVGSMATRQSDSLPAVFKSGQLQREAAAASMLSYAVQEVRAICFPQCCVRRAAGAAIARGNRHTVCRMARLQ
jgi:hypothetical protein